jgi:hypothetical protein
MRLKFLVLLLIIFSTLNFTNVARAQELVVNGEFSNGSEEPWKFVKGNWRNKFNVVDQTAELSLGRKANIQLYQNDIKVEENEEYTLSFKARSTTNGHGVDVYVMEHNFPYANLGLGTRVNVDANWQEFTFNFVAKQTVNDSRIRISPVYNKGELYFDSISLQKTSDIPVVIPTPTPTPVVPTPTPTPIVLTPTPSVILPTVTPTIAVTPTPSPVSPTPTPAAQITPCIYPTPTVYPSQSSQPKLDYDFNNDGIVSWDDVYMLLDFINTP